jgi:hypothetical protein
VYPAVAGFFMSECESKLDPKRNLALMIYLRNLLINPELADKAINIFNQLSAKIYFERKKTNK